MSARTSIRRLLNGAWITACSREQARFNDALSRVAHAQEQYLLNLLRRNAGTRFGEKHGFAQIRSVADYQERVPITPYDKLAPYIEAVASGETAVLTSEPVRLFQPTSGSTSATKLIPWTAGVAAEFRKAIGPWIATLYRRKPALLRGTAYWSVSPPATAIQTRGCLRVGFAHDAEYLGCLGRKLFSFVSSVPAEVARSRDMHEFRTRTLLHLLADADLGLISVWSPTFLTTLLEHFLTHRDEILDRLRRQHGGPRAKRRAEFLSAISSDGRNTAFFEEVWPELQVISCWTHGPSEIYAQNLRRFFPTVEVQGKGLIATEAFVSLPFRDEQDPVLAVISHFFEFQHLDGERVSLAHELALGHDYRVIVTTGGGLYRYALGDRVRVTGFIQGAPCLRFLGREGNISDLFGEKLHGTAVEAVIRWVLANQAIQARFFLLAPVPGQIGAGYALFLDSDPVPDPAKLCRELDGGLAENFHYAHCRHLGQLSQARLFVVQQNTGSAEEVFQRQMLSRGMKAGDIKPMPLDCHSGWERLFDGHFVA